MVDIINNKNMNKSFNDLVMVEVRRTVRMELKVQAALSGKTTPEYLEDLINREKNKRLLKK